MAYLQIRVSESRDATAAQTDRHCVETEGCLADTVARQDLSLWIWPRTTPEKPLQDLEQGKQKLEFILPFSAQDVSFKMDLGAIYHCAWLHTSNQTDPNQYRMEAMVMTSFREIRASDLVYAAAKTTDLHCVEADGSLADGLVVYNLYYGFWTESTIGKQAQDSEQSKQGMELFLPFLAQNASCRTDLVTTSHRSWLFQSIQSDPNQRRIVAFPPERVMPRIGSSACVLGKTIRQTVPIPPLGK